MLFQSEWEPIPVTITKEQSQVIPVIIAALLFGTATPLIKLLLSVSHPVAGACFLYLGAGAGILGADLVTSSGETIRNISFSLRRYAGWLAGTVITGGIIAPVVQFAALSVTSAATASLLLNFEIIATTGIAWGIFRERIQKNLLLAIILVLAGSLILSADAGSFWGVSLGAAGIICSCIFWGLDNNLMGNIALNDPRTIVIIKGLAGGSILFLIMTIMNIPLPTAGVIFITMVTGFFTFGLGLVFLIESMNVIGVAKTGAYFATAPFIGTIISLALFGQIPGLQILVSIPLFAGGVVVLFYGHEEGLVRKKRPTAVRWIGCPAIERIGLSLSKISATIAWRRQLENFSILKTKLI